MSRRGFTLVELMLALLLVGTLGAVVYRLLSATRWFYGQQTARIAVAQDARLALLWLPGALRELDPTDPAGSDLVLMNATSLRYRSVRGLYVLCRPPDTAALRIVIDNAPSAGLRPPDPERDSLLVFAEGNPDAADDDGWLHADLVAAVPALSCPGARPSLELQLRGPAAAAAALVRSGAPLRAFELTEVRLYRDGLGEWWLGQRRYLKRLGTWEITQPVVGPLASGGLRLAYYDVTGAPTDDPARVARLAISLVVGSAGAVRGARWRGGVTARWATAVAPRNGTAN